MHVDATLQKLNFGKDALTEVHAIFDRINQLQGPLYQVRKDFSYTSGQIDDLRHKVSMIKLLLTLLSKELTNSKTKLTVLRDPMLM